MGGPADDPDRRRHVPAAAPEPGAAGDPLLKLVIFDCDGVLVDSERLAVRIDVEVLGRLGWPLTEEEVVERFLGV
jgi:hypothetical protein